MKEEFTKICPKCKKEVRPIMELLSDTFNVENVDVKAAIWVYRCPRCKSEIWDEQNEKDNEVIIYNKYQQLMKEKNK